MRVYKLLRDHGKFLKYETDEDLIRLVFYSNSWQIKNFIKTKCEVVRISKTILIAHALII